MTLTTNAKQLIINSLMADAEFGFIFQEMSKVYSDTDELYNKCCQICDTLWKLKNLDFSTLRSDTPSLLGLTSPLGKIK